LKKTLTGIEGLDELLQGGIPKGWGVLLTGGTGTGKTTLAVQYLYNGYKKYDETGVFVSLEEDCSDIIRVMKMFGWDLETLHKNKKLLFINAIPKKGASDRSEYVIETPFFSRTFNFDTICSLLDEKINEIDAQRIVIDGLSSLTLQYNDDFKIRQGLLDITNLIRSYGSTAIYTSEIPEGSAGISRFGIEEFIAHGVIILYYIRERGKRIRAVEIRKMRGTKHDQALHPYEITNNGFSIFSEDVAFI
jgi:KaiC/GvpD/RAD55 family RecA-like ATPase